MYPSNIELNDLCEMCNPAFPLMGEQNKEEYRYRIRDAYHLVTTGQQAPVSKDEHDVADALPEFRKQSEVKAEAAEAERKKLKEIDQKAAEEVAKIQAQENEYIAKLEAQKAEIKQKAEEAKAKVEAEAAAAAAKETAPKEKTEREKAEREKAEKAAHEAQPNQTHKKG